ncbi:unnamed protein product [Oreochromis niloticus]|nr:unnamed protein product [Mustela putorius furo]
MPLPWFRHHCGRQFCMFSFNLDTLIPITSVQLGETVTFTCHLRKDSQFSRREVSWYKQSTGDTLKIIWTLKESAQPEFSAEFNQSRWKVYYNENFTNLTILRANQEDEGIYHCGITEWFKNTEWSGSYLLVKGRTQRTSDYTVVQSPLITVQEPGNSVTFQCSVFSDPDKKTCPGDLTVLWFRAGSHKSYPKLIYTDRNKSKECDKRSDPQKSCNYTFSKIVNSSDEGTYYCAVATCWELFFGNGTKLQIEQKAGSEFTVLVIAIICLFISVILTIVCCRTQRGTCEQCKDAVALQANVTAKGDQKIPQEGVKQSDGVWDKGVFKSVGSRPREKQPVAEQTPLVIYDHMQRMPNIVHNV